MDIFAAIQESREQFSRSEQMIADILTGDFDFAVNASITDLAARAGVSPPTVTRFCRRLGCQNFSDFKVRLARTAYVGARYINPGPQSTDPADVAADVVTAAQDALFRMHRDLDAQLLARAAQRLARAEMVYAFGAGGNSAMIAGEIQNRLFRLGLRVTSSSDHAMQLMMAAAARPADVLIGSSISGRNTELAKALALARQSSVFTIALTQAESPVAAAADLVIPVSLPEGDNIFRPSSLRYAWLALVDIIANLVAHESRTTATVTLRHIKQQLVAHRDGDDRQLLGD